VEGEDGCAKIDAVDFGSIEIGQGMVRFFGPKANALTGGSATGAAGALGGGGFADAGELKLVDAALGVVTGDASEAAVDDGSDAVDRERGLSDVGGEDDFAAAGGLKDAGLFLGSEIAVQREQEEIFTMSQRIEAIHDTKDLTDAREEDQDIAGIFRLIEYIGEGINHAFGKSIIQPLNLGGAIGDVHGKGASFGADNGAAPEKLRDGRCVQRRGHDDEHQVFADGLLNLAKQGDSHVGMKAALVKLVKKHGTDAREKGVVKKLAGEDAFSKDADAGVIGELAIEANVVADFVTKLPVVFLGDSSGGGAGGDAAGLEHDEVGMFRAEEAGAQDGGWNAGGFTGPRGRDQHQAAAATEFASDLRENIVDRKGKHV
jgi:hypothetical protein